jgi:hypothetical protein
MSSDHDVSTIAERLFGEKFRAAGWTDSDFNSFPGGSIQQAVIAIAAGGEQAAMRQILSMHATGQLSDAVLDRCTEVIQEARHAAFPGNTGWLWDGDSSRWTARRGTAMVTAAYPRDVMPPVPADRFAVQLTGEHRWGTVLQVMENPGEANLPWGRPVLAEIPEEFWTDDWCRGVRAKIILGMLCSPCGRTDARVCLQPRRESQAEGMEADCVPVDPDHIRLIVLDGKLPDYR